LQAGHDLTKNRGAKKTKEGKKRCEGGAKKERVTGVVVETGGNSQGDRITKGKDHQAAKA